MKEEKIDDNPGRFISVDDKYKESKSDVRKKLKEGIKKVLAQHVGKDNCIKMKEILDIIGEDYDSENNNSRIRDIISEMLEDANIPIASISGPKGGYFLAKTKEDFDAGIHNLSIKEQGLVRRIEKLIRLKSNLDNKGNTGIGLFEPMH